MSTPVTVIGRLGGDPELRFTQSGKSIASFSMVTSKSSQRTDGTWDESETTWYRVEAWESLGENVVECLRKGDAVIVYGRMYMDSYQAKDGSGERQSLKVNAYSIGPDLKKAPYRKADASAPARPAASGSSDNPWTAPAGDIPPF